MSTVQNTADTKTGGTPPSGLSEFWFYFSRNKGAVIGLAFFLVILFVAVFAPFVAPHSPSSQNRELLLLPPVFQDGGMWGHILGTDAVGRAILSRLIYGARFSLFIGLVVVTLSVVSGVLIGLIAGYFRGKVDTFIMRIMDIILAFPSLLLAILMAIMISHGQSGLWSGIFASGISITVVYIPQYFRTIRAEVIRIKESAYVESARVGGASTWRIMTKHLFKNSTRTLPVILTLNSSEAILTLAGLGFLGFGIRHFCIVKSVVPGFMFAGIDIACQIFGNISVEHRAKDIVLEIPTVHSTTKFISDCPYRTVQLVPLLLFLCINHCFRSPFHQV